MGSTIMMIIGTIASTIAIAVNIATEKGAWEEVAVPAASAAAADQVAKGTTCADVLGIARIPEHEAPGQDVA